MALYEKQKETAGTWAAIVWIGSGLILYLTTEGASLWSWSALVFFVVGMFAAAIVFGVAIYGLQRGLSKALLKVAKVPTPGVVTAIRSIGWVLFFVETVVIYLAASWVFHEILEPARAELPTELSDERILSKDDARVMFSMSKDQWLANVQQAVTTGVANAMGTPETGLGMATSTPGGDLLIVRPNYGENDQKPDFIQVTVGYREPRATLLTDSVLEDAIQAARAQMEPEYDVIGTVERLPGGVSVFFIITEERPQ